MRKHRNLLIVIFGVVLAFYLVQWEGFRNFLLNLKGLGLVGAFIAGGLFVSSLTVSLGAVTLGMFTEIFPPWQLGIVGGLGATVVDFLTFRFLRNQVFHQIKPVTEHLKEGWLLKIYHFLNNNKFLSWSLVILGALIIASPLPDEIGIAMMGISQIKPSHFLLITFLLNSLGIFLLLSALVLIFK